MKLKSMKTKIEPIKVVKSLDFANCTHHDFWLYREKTESSISLQEFSERLSSLFENLNDATICICAEQVNNLEVIRLFLFAASNNN